MDIDCLLWIRRFWRVCVGEEMAALGAEAEEEEEALVSRTNYLVMMCVLVQALLPPHQCSLEKALSLAQLNWEYNQKILDMALLQALNQRLGTSERLKWRPEEDVFSTYSVDCS
jgi:hypothetical protein